MKEFTILEVVPWNVEGYHEIKFIVTDLYLQWMCRTWRSLENVCFIEFSSQMIYHFSSMFFNEDGDLAHEFYEEVKSRKKKKSKMKKVDQSSLTPQVPVLK